MFPLRFLSVRRRLPYLLLCITSGFICRRLLLSSESNIDFRPLLPEWIRTHEETLVSTGLAGAYQANDSHPISLLIAQADKTWRAYEDGRSKSFREVLNGYRQRNGRNPPPRFDEWYLFARRRSTYDLDDFEQITNDIRPFWGVSPATIRALAARMWEEEDKGVANIHVRSGKIAAINRHGWRIDTMATMIDSFVGHLPDMDIAMNTLDQPRVTVPWSELQALLLSEAESRHLKATVWNNFTSNMPGFTDLRAKPSEIPREDAHWVMAPTQQYMNFVRRACPPTSHANGGTSSAEAERAWKSQDGGVVTNFNLSTDLCTVGPEIQNLHGFLFASSSLLNTERLLPIFGECKVSVNNDILFPANMYWRQDERYKYNGQFDLDWKDKTDKVFWRGVPSGGVQTANTWATMHRHRLVMALNATAQADNAAAQIMIETPESQGEYESLQSYKPAAFLDRFSDVGFTELYGCVPEDCRFLLNVFEMKPQTSLSQQFLARYLVDVDGHSFSGRWRAFLQSKALGIKATIFREWHDLRLIAWRHFVPLDNRFDDIHTIMTYFIGMEKQNASQWGSGEPFVQSHGIEAKRLALQGREWANKVLRNDDIEVYMFLLLLEYGRIIDDNRHEIGYNGDGSELDEFDALHPME